MLQEFAFPAVKKTEGPTVHLIAVVAQLKTMVMISRTPLIMALNENFHVKFHVVSLACSANFEYKETKRGSVVIGLTDLKTLFRA